MDIEERNNLFEKFLRNGMSLEEFRFNCIEDKQNLFFVFEEYLKSMLSSDKKISLLSNVDGDVTIYIDNIEICMFEIDYSYTTVMCHTSLSLEDEDLIYCMTMFFLTVKELRSVILGLMKNLTNVYNKTKDRSQNSDSRKNGKYKILPKGAEDIVNKIEAIQNSILKNLSDNKKYITAKDENE